MGAPNPEKGSKYLGLLDQALCNGNWSEVPELSRKTDKHAPGRKALTAAAKASAQSATDFVTLGPRSTQSTRPGSAGLNDSIEVLKNAITANKVSEEDVYIATTALAEIYWLQEDEDGILGILPQNPNFEGSIAHGGSVLGWLEVCAVKRAFLRGVVLENRGEVQLARQLYTSASKSAPGTRSSELRRWTERLLSHATLFLYNDTSDLTLMSFNKSLRCFLSWSDFWQRSGPQNGSSGGMSILDIPRRRVWGAYYKLLSTILQYGLWYTSSSAATTYLLTTDLGDLDDNEREACKSRQRASFKKIEKTYESLLLNETQFPKANQTNLEVEEWVEEVMSNWRIFMSDGWTDADLRSGGREMISRDVLDILYRAATKTFHSTSILRHLFTVHAVIGEFEIAMDAYDSYVELFNKSRARAMKAGKPDAGSDSLNLATRTATEAIRILCRYGDVEQAQKALAVAKEIHNWLGSESSPDGRSHDSPDEYGASSLTSETLAAAYRSIGIARANWTRISPQSERRAELRAEALRLLQRSLSYEQQNLDSVYAYSLILAESGDISTAIKCLKQAITATELNPDEAEAYTTKARQLCPLWHLLALCLTAKDDYAQAVKVCDAAFEQFGDLTVLFGSEPGPYSVEDKSEVRLSRGLVDRMEDYEKEGVLQIKVTQLTAIELIEGPDVALEQSDTLLSLYSRLFGTPPTRPQTSRPRTTGTVPTTRGSTLRSLAGSIKEKSIRRSVERDTSVRQSSVSTAGTQDPDSGGRAPIAITITNEDGQPEDDLKRSSHSFKLRGTAGDWRKMNSFTSKNPELFRGPPTADHENFRTTSTSSGHAGSATMPGINENHALDHIVSSSNAMAMPDNSKQDIKAMPLNAAHDTWPPPAGHEHHPPDQDVRLPTPHPASSAPPEPRLPSAKDKQHKISILVKLWLFIAGMYMRAQLLDDGNEAVKEAAKLIEGFEKDSDIGHSQAQQIFERGWGGGKSVDHLWADVLALQGELAQARGQPFDAMSRFDQALALYPDHPDSIIGVSSILMDIYEEKLPAEKPAPGLVVPVFSTPQILTKQALINNNPIETTERTTTNKLATDNTAEPTSAQLHRLAARDRAYMLLSNLTRLGSAWNNSEAWYMLSRAHELSQQYGKAKQALWWVVQLEETRPARSWHEIGPSGFTL